MPTFHAQCNEGYSGPVCALCAPGYLMQWLHQRRPMHAAPLAGGWHDIGNLETLERARRAYAEHA